MFPWKFINSIPKNLKKSDWLLIQKKYSVVFYSYFPLGSQNCINVDVALWRCIDVNATLYNVMCPMDG